MKQPFSRLTYISTAEELIDLGFKRASKAEVQFSNKDKPVIKAIKRESVRIELISHTLNDKLRLIIKEMPKLDTVDPFYNELANVIIGVDKLKKSLGALNWASDMIGGLSKKSLRRIRWVRDPRDAARIRREYYGRVASITKQIAPDLKLLESARKELRKIPTVDLNESTITIVVAGYANVGKSTYVKAVSSAKPAIEPYPFTTKGLVLGHRETDYGIIQVVDTPGLLDRPLSDRNKIELQAIAALKYLAKVIIFLFDPTTTCGYEFSKQVNLYNEVREQFKTIPIVPVFNKMDMLSNEQIEESIKMLGTSVMLMSAEKNIGVKEVLDATLEKIKKI